MANEPNEDDRPGRQRDLEDAQRRSSTNLVPQGVMQQTTANTSSREQSPLPQPIAMSAEPSASGRVYAIETPSSLRELHYAMHDDTDRIRAASEAHVVGPDSSAMVEETIATDAEGAEDTSGAVTEEEGDDAAFWGEGITSPAWHLPSGGWVSPRLLARATSSGEETMESTSPNSASWTLDPRHWRLGSPNFFSRSEEHLSSQVASPPRGRTIAREEPTRMSSANAGTWAIDPRQWRLGSPSFFNSSNTGTQEQTENPQLGRIPGEHDVGQEETHSDNKSPVRNWINSRIIAAGFGGASDENAIEDSDDTADGDSDESMEESDSDREDEDPDGEGDGDETLNEMELQLPGHR
ncbi:MAG: hypothetical protein M1828_000556 [Chrysothrix sp. TS-e1954]|nr:MAG: hypothetical protein M1828_000556 [Chrysothrix sp. TS-e1954]